MKKSKHSEVTTVTKQNNSTILIKKVNVKPESIQTSQMNDTESVEMIPLHSAETEVKKGKCYCC